MEQQAKEIKSFFYGQAFADGLRITVSILLPALIGFQFHYKTVGLAISLGALCVSITDAPGPTIHKRNGMLFCSFFIFVIALITSIAKLSVVTMGIEIALVCFFFSMFSVYGNRAASVGSAAILIMILTMDDPTIAGDALFHSSLILLGGIWYMIISLLASAFLPYRLAQRTLGDCIREIARYVSVKSAFYDLQTDLKDNYTKMVSQQITVNERQDAVREVLFKTSATVRESTPMGRKLVMTFVEAVDFFEDTTAAFYDYAALRSRFGHTGILQKISGFLSVMSTELDDLGLSIQMNANYTPASDFNKMLTELKESIDAMGSPEKSNLVLKKILVNLRKLVQRLELMENYFRSDVKTRKGLIDHSHFVSHQTLSPVLFWNNLSLSSSVFRHALRVAFACLVGFLIVRWIGYGQHTYWVLLTIAFILKPAFSLTKQRNKERLTGTIIGGSVGVFMLLFITNTNILFVLMVIFMVGTYSFLRTNYLAMVICVTPFVLILFNFLGLGFIEVFKERILDTLIGCAIAFPTSYFLLPSWESEQLKGHIIKTLKANSEYLALILQAFSGKAIETLHYKLARKEVYVHTANLTALFQRMLSEPRNKQKRSSNVHELVVLNHIFFSNIANLGTTLAAKEKKEYSRQVQASGIKALSRLNESITGLDATYKPSFALAVKKEDELDLPSQDDLLLKDQLDYLAKLAEDIKKTTALIEA